MKIEKAVDLAIQNVLKEGLTDIFPRPFEVDLLKNKYFLDEVSRNCVKRIKSNSLQGLFLHPIQHVLFPKKDPFDFRRAALIEPIDTITTLAIAILIAEVIEKHRPAKAKKKVFSYRYKPKGGYIFDANYNFTAFEKNVRQKVNSNKYKVLVKCDIASFYDRLNIHRLESTLSSLLVENSHVKLLNEILLFWAKRDSYGLPIGGNASRIFAEAALIAVDDFLISNNVIFCRFVDDYRFFAVSTEKAHSWLTLFVERLFREGLTINPSKTALEDISKQSQPEESAKITNPASGGNENIEKSPNRIIVGYSGIVPTKFRKITDREVTELESENIDSYFEELKNSYILKPEEFRKLFKIIVAQNKFELIYEALKILDKFPQFTPFCVDIIIKFVDKFDETEKIKISDYFAEKTRTIDGVPEYILVSVVRLLGASGFEKKDELMALFRQLRRNSGAYVGRSIIDALTGLCNRTDALEVREYFDRADLWEKRAIIRLVEKHLPEAEKRPWLKNVKVHQSSDLFAIESFEPRKK